MCSCGALFICRSGFSESPYALKIMTPVSVIPAAKIPQISHRAMDRDSIPRLSPYLRRVVGWKACDLNYNNNRNKTDLSSSSLQPALPACLAWPHCLLSGPLTWSHPFTARTLGVGIFFLSLQPSALPIFILTLWKTRRPSSSTAILFPRRGSYSLLDDYMKTVLHRGRLWPLQRADNPEVLHIYALWTAIVLRVLPATVAAGLARRKQASPRQRSNRNSSSRQAAAAEPAGAWLHVQHRPHQGMKGNPRHSAEK